MRQGAVAVEWVATQEGLGAMIRISWQTPRTEGLYLSLSVTAFLGILFNILLQRISTHFLPWQTERDIFVNHS